jgi:hypothetical protein
MRKLEILISIHLMSGSHSTSFGSLLIFLSKIGPFVVDSLFFDPPSSKSEKALPLELKIIGN